MRKPGCSTNEASEISEAACTLDDEGHGALTRTVWHCHVAVSLDGKIARSDGSFEDWLADYPAEDFGFQAFFEDVGAILMGRASYDAVRRLGDWPYGGKPAFVMTTRTLRNPPPLVQARSGTVATVAAELESQGHRRIWLMGGGQLLRAMLAVDKLDVLEIGLIPTVLGEGIPLFPDGTTQSAFRLVSCKARSRGALHLVYQRAAATGSSLDIQPR